MRALAIAALVLPGWILAGAFLVTEYRKYGPELMEHMFLDASGLTVLFHLLILLAPLASTALGVFVYDRFRLMEGFRELSFRYLDFYENAPYGYHSIGPDMVFQDVNDTWLEMLGYDRDDVVGRMKAIDLLPEDARARGPELFDMLRSKGGFQNIELEFLCKDGSRLPVVVSSSSVYDEAGEFVRSRTIVKDNSERKKLEGELVASVEKWKATFDSMPWGVALLDGDGKVVARNRFFERFDPILSLDDVVTKHCNAGFGHAPGNGPYVSEHHDDALDRYFSLSSTTMGQGGGYVASVVDITESRHGQKKLLDSRDAFFNMLKDASIAFEELDEAHSGLIVTLANTIDAKSPWTKGHSERVTHYAMAVGRALGLGDRELSRLRTAALLHDIGKLAIFDTVLNKASGLTVEEYEVIKAHPEKSSSILAPIERFSDIIEIVRHHHERWDGKGYPLGLKGEEIPLMARVLCIADSFDSMTADRPYRPAQSREYAIKEFRDCSGTHFDPRLATMFIKLLDEGKV